MGWAETKGFLPGVTIVMHTFGSKLNFNCHLHVLYTLGGYSAKNGQWKPYTFVSAESIKKRFKTILLAKLRLAYTNNQIIITPDIKKLWRHEFKTDIFWHVQNILWNKEWYLWIGEEIESVQKTVGYIGRYAKRPSIAETRIIYYSKTENIVRFEYKDKITNKYEIINTTPIEFISLVVQHIPEKYFHMIRYYGAYANTRKSKIFSMIYKYIVAISGVARLIFELSLVKTKTWRQRKIELTGIDPLKCQHCNLVMRLSQIGYRIRDGTFKVVNFF